MVKRPEASVPPAPTTANPRYVDRSLLRRAGERSVVSALDRLCGSRVIRKRGPIDEITREARVLLELPPGIAPILLDLEGGTDGFATLTLEQLDGKTLIDARPAAEEAREIALGLCAALSHLHRAGFVHSDLKPGNVIRLEGSGEVRLLDFGFAFRIDRGPEDAAGRGGSFGYAAPELVRGWRVDARADQYSLGVMLGELFPTLLDDAEWQPLLARLTAPMPSARFPLLLTVAEAIAGDSLPREFLPRLGGGPLRERQTILRDIAAAMRGTQGLVVVFGADGAGISRLILEIACEAMTLRLLDLDPVFRAEDDAGETAASDQLLCELLDEARARGESVLVGVSDSAPDVRSLERTHPGLRAKLRSAPRVHVPRLGREALVEIFVRALGAVDASAEEVARAIHARTEGDLYLSALAFDRVVRSGVRREGAAWHIASANIDLGAERPHPGWDDVPEDQRPDLELVALCGNSPSRELLDSAFERFGADDGASRVDRLIDAGWLVPRTDLRLAFAARGVLDGARTQRHFDHLEVDRWMLSAAEPDFSDPLDVRAALERARRVGNEEAERRYLSGLFSRATSERREAVYLKALDDPERPWSLADAEAYSKRVADLLGAEWPPSRILFALARGLHLRGDPLGAQCLEHLSLDFTQPFGPHAAFELASYFRSANHREQHARLWARLEELERIEPERIGGRMELERARQARDKGDIAAASARAQRAEGLLGAIGSVYALDALLLQASLHMPARPAEAAALLERAVDQSKGLDMQTMALNGLAQIHELTGDLESFASVSEAAADSLSALESDRHALRVLPQRAWAWALLDRVGEAEAEAARLLRLFEHRIEPARRATLHLLLGFTALHRGERRRALSANLIAWDTAKTGASAMWRSVILRSLIDACLELDNAEMLREVVSTISSEETNTEAYSPLCRARWQALLAQADEQLDRAVAHLRDGKEAAARLTDRIEAARFLHHLGLLELATGRAEAALEAFDGALARLGATGTGHFRVEALRGRGRALAEIGDRLGALDALGAAVVLARQLDCRASLAGALVEQGRLKLAD